MFNNYSSMIALITGLLLVVGNVLEVVALLSCRSENGSNVDWFTLYKLPKLKVGTNPHIRNGTAHAFLTSQQSDSWQLSSKSINDTTSMVGHTLAPLYEIDDFDTANIGYMIYNDEHGEHDLISRAHAKGVIIFDETSAIWVIHSVPDYPPLPSERPYQYGSSQTKYGQSMLCVSLTFTELAKVGKQLYYIWPQVIETYIPTSIASNKKAMDEVLYYFNQVANNKKVMAAPWKNSETITSRDGQLFRAFHKATKFADDLYASFVAPGLQSPLFTETWSKGSGGVLASNCSNDYAINEIDRVKLRLDGDNEVAFSVMSDHSKWAVSQTGSGKHMCSCDMNRFASQFKRGGGCLCFENNAKVYEAYSSIIEQIEPCTI